ncbi:hypothetical protein [Stenotrophomonas sp. NPDC077659]|uniref:hypothetical protein n=1 Tax=Stenotrophomonas sp. NPDC077659 TaxID=3390694 RepID=UPI003D089885
MRVVSSLLAACLGIILTACKPATEPAAVTATDLPAPIAASAAAEPAAEGNRAAGSVAFRATGNEPGWLAVVGGDSPGLEVQVDYGERRFQVAAPTAGADGWVGKAADGTDIKLSFQRTTCQDDMSGETFEVKAMLTVGAHQYHGCGSFGATQP